MTRNHEGSLANQRQVGGEHYKRRGKMEHWDMVQEFQLDYFQGQITKYLFRHKEKGGVQDLEKAKHYLEKYIELQKKTVNRITAAKVGDTDPSYKIGDDPQENP